MAACLDRRFIVWHTTQEPCSFPLDFSSVNDFLRKASSAKNNERQAIEEGLSPLIEDPALIGVPPEMADCIEHFVGDHGDEALRQIGLFCIGKWMKLHAVMVDEHGNNEDWPEALHVMNDASKLSTAMQIIEQVGSFGGDDSWRKMLRGFVSQSILEKLEEDGNHSSLLSFFFGEQ